ncbi:DUF1028 domain-containing protein [Celeribacter neptunius]|uniref:Uncharacterized conserved protein, Ntn-hydrolase superfamily n=1 Tax=Celeribacter neptunius TaxID=588602 RepID=A0A1I3NRE0_9RHOB|nr:DUF1028 domain-containing protein [Celeribacter neptunius]SFJ11851.1 Uncharacterized conserved protein, Ntn-hydrolase superfamily [Celeribacter neptunius]
MTYSIVARDPDTGHLGIAVASRFFAVGSLVPQIDGKVAVASQAFVNPLWGVDGAAQMAEGLSAATVITGLAARDTFQSQRQAHMIDLEGRSAAHTGADCIDWAGHRIADGVSVAGNMLVGPAVVEDTLAAYLDHMDLPFAERLLLAMEAGEAAGGDKRGKQAAALRIHRGEAFPWIDIRADDHADPLAELRRLLSVAGERALFFADELGHSGSFSGRADRSILEAGIAKAEQDRAARGLSSQSFATNTDI